MAKKSAKLTWGDTEELAFRLIDEHPQLDPSKLTTNKLVELVTKLRDFGEKTRKPDVHLLEELQTRWHEERSEMEDELGPYQDLEVDEDSELDEDVYRDDKMVEDDDDEDDRDEVSLDEAFEDEDEDEDDEDELY